MPNVKRTVGRKGWTVISTGHDFVVSHDTDNRVFRVGSESEIDPAIEALSNDA